MTTKHAEIDERRLRALTVTPGAPAGLLGTRLPADKLGLTEKAAAQEHLEALTEQLARLQNHLYAEGARSVLVILQGMDAAGKDGTIRRVFTGVNPQGCTVASFKVPSDLDRAHDYLWRVHTACPERGDIGIWNRSHYEDLVTARVVGTIDDRQRDRRVRHVREFERMLHEEGTRLLKVFLHISKDEQRARLQARLDDPEKRWKFNPSDLDTRARWAEYLDAYEHVVTATSSRWAPWHVVPADHKWVRDVAVATLLVRILAEMAPRVPAADPSLDHIEVV